MLELSKAKTYFFQLYNRSIRSHDMRKTIDFGKIAYNGKRKINSVDLEVELRETDKGPEFSVCGSVWNSKHTDIVAGGQCLDELSKFLSENKLFQKIYKLWKLYHLNGMHAGTPAQEKYLAEHRTWHNDYEKDCECLKAAGLLTVQDGAGQYTYGHAWLYWPIPENDLSEIKQLLA